MKKLKTVEEQVVVEKREEVVDEPGGWESYIGKTLLFHCGSYNYLGRLVGVNGRMLELANAGVVFETGPYTGNCKKDFQPVKGGMVLLGIGFIEAAFEPGAQ